MTIGDSWNEYRVEDKVERCKVLVHVRNCSDMVCEFVLEASDKSYVGSLWFGFGNIAQYF